jgi:outer membrane biosynthesis protein TonB
MPRSGGPPLPPISTFISNVLPFTYNQHSAVTKEVSGEKEPGRPEMVGEIVGERWRVVEALGPTARGKAFRVEELEKGRAGRLDLWDARHVAERGRLAQLEREARIVSQLQHPRCLALFQFGVDGGRPFYVWEPAAGKPLGEELGKPELSVARALAIALQVLEGVRHLHAHGVVHRGLTADNVVIGGSLGGEAVWVGPLRMGVPAGGDRTFEAPGDQAFQPPEQKSGRPDHRGDLYAVGMLLYAMCTGRVPSPVAAGTAYPAPRAVAPERPLEDALEKIVMRAIAPSPDARFQTADDFIEALQRRSAIVSPRPLPALAERPPRRRRVAILVGGALAVALLGAIVLLLTRGSPRRKAPPPPAPPAAKAEAPARAVEAVAPKPVAAPAPAPKPVAVPAPAPAPPPRSVAPPEVAVRPVPPPAPRPPAHHTAGDVPSAAERTEIGSLLENGKLDEADRRITPLINRHPDAAWPHLARADLYFLRRWRHNAVVEWERALERDPALRRDRGLGLRVCAILDPKWEAAGAHQLLVRLGSEASPVLRRCIASASSPQQRVAAQRALARLGQ